MHRAIIVVLLISFPLSTAPGTAALTDGLVAHYAFDDGTGDVLAESTGLGTDGDLLDFPDDDSQWVSGQVAGALEFDGQNDHVIAPEYELAEDALSVSLWAWADSAPTWASLVKNWGNTVVGQFHFGLGEGTADTLNVFITTSDGQAFNAGTDPEPLSFGEWHHVAFVADPEQMLVTMYRDGEVVSEQAYDGTFISTPNSTALGIGVKTDNSGEQADPGACCPAYWDGKLDDLGVWTRALSETEISEIYENGLRGIGIVAGGRDLNGDGNVDILDLAVLEADIAAGTATPADGREFVEVVLNSYLGDADGNGEFNSDDLLVVFSAGEYDDDVPQNSTFIEGDWNFDGDFNSDDLLDAFATGAYLAGPRGRVAVPEPTSLLLLLSGGLASCRRRSPRRGV